MRDAVHGRGPADVGLVGGDVDTHLARGDQQEPQRDGEQLALDHDQDDDIYIMMMCLSVCHEK